MRVSFADVAENAAEDSAEQGKGEHWDTLLYGPAPVEEGGTASADVRGKPAVPQRGSHLWRVVRQKKVEKTLEPSEEEAEAASESARKRLLSDPDGNLYRGWAVGIQKGTWQLFMTLLVIFLQVFGPFAMVWWAYGEIQKGKFEVYRPAWDELTVLFQKMLGLGFLSLVFINGENILMRADMQTDMLRTLFTNAKSGWMFTDSFVNSWCIAFCAAAAGPLLWTSEDGIKDVILDSFGLLFLHNIDEYSADVEYGIETSDFDDIIDEKQLELNERLLNSSNAKDQEENRLRRNWKKGCFVYGDVWFSVGRVANSVIACITLPAYASLVWVRQDAPDSGSQDTEQWNEGWKPGDSAGDWGLYHLIASGCMYGLVLLSRAYSLAVIGDQPVTIDCLGIFIWMLVGRSDPRCLDKDMVTKVSDETELTSAEATED